MNLQAKKCHGLREPLELRGRHGSLWKGPTLTTPSFWTSDLQNGEEVNVCCCKPPNLWYFVTAALGNEDSLRALLRTTRGLRAPRVPQGLCKLRAGPAAV